MKKLLNSIGSRHLTPFMVSALLGFSSGCWYLDVAWLPASSGFIYMTPKRELVRYDVATGQRQVLVADTRTTTVSPAVSPDGKRIAVARLVGKTKIREGVVLRGPDLLEVVVYDLDGKESHRSPEVVWRKEGRYHDPSDGRDPRVELLWAPKHERLLIAETLAAGYTVGIFDLQTNGLVMAPIEPVNRFAIRPDGHGFVVFDPQKRVAFIDWQGRTHEIAMKREVLEKWHPGDGISLGPPSFQWKGNTFTGLWDTGCLSIDTE
jgi:hypothetical protein